MRRCAENTISIRGYKIDHTKTPVHVKTQTGWKQIIAGRKPTNQEIHVKELTGNERIKLTVGRKTITVKLKDKPLKTRNKTIDKNLSLPNKKQIILRKAEKQYNDKTWTKKDAVYQHYRHLEIIKEIENGTKSTKAEHTAKHPDTPIETLKYLHKRSFKNEPLQKALTKNPNIPKNLLTKIYNTTTNSNTLTSILQNPNISKTIINHTLTNGTPKNIETLSTNLALTKQEQKRILKKTKPDSTTWINIAKTTSDETLIKYILTNSEKTKVAVCSNRSTPKETLKKLAEQELEQKHHQNHDENPLLLAAAGNLNTPQETLQQIAETAEHWVASALARNPNSSKNTLLTVFNHNHGKQRILTELAGNENTPEELTWTLLRTTKRKTKTWINLAEHTTNEKQIDYLIKNSGSHTQTLSKIARNPNLTPKQKQKIAKNLEVVKQLSKTMNKTDLDYWLTSENNSSTLTSLLEENTPERQFQQGLRYQPKTAIRNERVRKEITKNLTPKQIQTLLEMPEPDNLFLQLQILTTLTDKQRETLIHMQKTWNQTTEALVETVKRL